MLPLGTNSAPSTNSGWLSAPEEGLGGGALVPIEIKSASDQVAGRLVTAIALGEFVPGQRLPIERELASLLGVSRTTLRTALQELASLGFVEIRRGRNGGTFVLSSWQPASTEMIRRTLLPNRERLEQLLDFRQAFEPLVAHYAATRRDRDDLSAMQTALAAYLNAGDDREASRAADEELHTAIAGATHNAYFAGVSRRLRADLSFGLHSEPYSPAIRKRAIGQHSDLVAAIVDGDAELASRVAKYHFAMTQTMLNELIERVNRSGRCEGDDST